MCCGGKMFFTKKAVKYACNEYIFKKLDGKEKPYCTRYEKKLEPLGIVMVKKCNQCLNSEIDYEDEDEVKK